MKRVLIAVLGLVVASAPSAFAGAVITHTSGTVKLGVNDEGHLNFDDPTPGSEPTNSSRWGVAFDFGGGVYQDVTSPGCFCEGWGVAVNGGNAGFANVSTDAGANNLTVQSFGSTANTATSVVSLTSLPGVTVSHEYAPSSSSALFQAKVTITNNTGAEADFEYRRVMDWDVPPTEFDEFVTIGGWPADNLVASSNNGFASANPLSAQGTIAGCAANANFNKCGPADHGAVFDFAFNDIAAGDSVEFFIYYGGAFGENAILSALSTVGAEVYSLGYSNDGGAANVDGAVFAFGFAGVGGTPVPDPVPEPGTMLLLGTGLSALALRRRRKV